MAISEKKFENIYRMKFIVFADKDSSIDGFLNHLNKTKQDFSETLGINIYSEKITYSNKIFQINLWHINNENKEKAEIARSLFTVGANGIIIVFNGKDPDALKKLSSDLILINKIFSKKIPSILLGNMVNGKMVPYPDSIEFAKKHGLLFTERYNYNLDIVLLASCMLSLGKEIPDVYRNLFGPNYNSYISEVLQISKDSLKEKELIPDLDSIPVQEDIWKVIWDGMWKNMKDEEELIIYQRLNRLESDLNNIISDYYTDKQIVSPLLEFFELPDPEDSKFPMLLKKWLEETPNKVEALKSFLKNEDNIQEKYWQDLYKLRLSMTKQKLEIFEKFNAQINKIIVSQKENVEKISEKLQQEDIPRRVALDLADGIAFIEKFNKRRK